MPSTEHKLKAEDLSRKSPFSLDTWALIIASILALAVKFDLLKNVSW